MQFECVRGLFYVNHPLKKVQTSVVKLAVQRIRVSNNSWLSALIIRIQSLVSLSLVGLLLFKFL